MVNGWSDGAVIRPTIPGIEKHYNILIITGARMNGGGDERVVRGDSVCDQRFLE